jgi:hypothetical protein
MSGRHISSVVVKGLKVRIGHKLKVFLVENNAQTRPQKVEPKQNGGG